MPQLAAPWFRHWPLGSAPPAGTGEQVPALPPSAQDRQLPLQLVAQQTPWAQTVLAHSAPVWQTAPFAFNPHEPWLQDWPPAQSWSVVQLDLHAFGPQVNGKQLVAAGTQQVPAPSQVPAALKVAPGTGQDAFAHAVPDGYFWQAPAWHFPSVPHELAP